ncbi:MAG: hypothetical protein VX278_20545, partial [Myxococcota bacterium]|nr:hypothetical protein [Myxococcota bacterium]
MLILPLLHLLSPAFGEDRILDLAESELLRSWEILSQKEEAAYWIGIHITDRFEESIRASEGSILSPDEKRFRYADIDVRVGDFSFDNTHPLRDSGFFGEDTHFGTYLPFENHPKAVKTELWKTIDEAYRHSVRRLIKLRSNDAVKV